MVQLDEIADGAAPVERVEQLDQALDLEALGADPPRLGRAQPDLVVLRDPCLDHVVGERHRAGAEDLERVEVERERLARVLAARVPAEAALVPRAHVDDLRAHLARQVAEHLERLQEPQPDERVAELAAVVRHRREHAIAELAVAEHALASRG